MMDGSTALEDQLASEGRIVNKLNRKRKIIILFGNLQGVSDRSSIDEFKLLPGQFIHGCIFQNADHNTVSICEYICCLQYY